MWTPVVAAIFLASLSLTPPAQGTRPGEVQGQIVNGKPVVNAQVTYVSISDGKEYRCVTGADGTFHLTGLPTGDYKVDVQDAAGEHIYSSRKRVFAADQQALNVVRIDLSIMSESGKLGSLSDQRDPGNATQHSSNWQRVTETRVPALAMTEIAGLRGKGALVTEYMNLRPDVHTVIIHRDWRNAVILLQQLIAIAPDKWELYQNLGIAQRNLEQYRDSIVSFEKGLQLIQRDAEIKKDRSKYREAIASMYLGEGESYFAQGDMHAAAAQFRQAAEVDSKPALAYIRLCSAEYNGGNNDAAISACITATELAPGETRFYQLLAGIQTNLEKYADAIQTFEKGLKIAQAGLRSANNVHSNVNSKSSAEISGADRYSRQIGQMLFGEGNAYFSLRKYKQAAVLFEQAAEKHPYPALAYFNLCAALYDMNDLAGASAACDKAIALDRALADAYFAKASAEYGLALRHSKFTPPGNATLALKKYLELAPMGLYSDRARALLQEAGSKN